MEELICISCPMGCRMTVEKSDGEWVVKGNTCPRGKEYAINEMTAPKRTVTTSVALVGGSDKTVSIKTDTPIDKALIFKALAELKNVEVKAPINIGDIIVENVLGSGVNFVATRKVNEK